MILSSTSDVLRVITGSAGFVDIFASWVDLNGTTVTPGRTANPGIITATTTVAVGSPGASTQRAVDFLSVQNDSISNQITVSHFDGATATEIVKVTLSPGDSLIYVKKRGWQVMDSAGRLKYRTETLTRPATDTVNTVVLSADVTNNNAVANTIQDVTGLSFAVITGETYWFRAVINYTAAATTTGSRWSVSGPASPGLLTYRSEYSLTTTTQTINEGLTAYDLPAASNVSSAATAGNIAIIEGFITPTSDGTLIVRFASEVLSSAIVAKAGSVLFWDRVL